MSNRTKCRGLSTMGWVLTTIAVVVAIPFVVFGFYEAHKAYWNAKVKEECAKDGGVTVYEHVTLSSEEYKRLGGTHGGLPIPAVDDQRTKAYPYFMDIIESKIRDSNPEVRRVETAVKRRADGKTLGKYVYYIRRGGDFPTGLVHESAFSCPSQSNLSNEIFKISEARK